MAQLSEAIARYHKLFYEDTYRDLTWVQEFQERVRERHLARAEQPGALVLRPHFISRTEVSRLTRTTEHLSAILDQIERLAFQTPSLLDRIQLLPAEKMLGAIPSGDSRFSITSRMDAHFRNGSLCIRGVEASNASDLAYSDRLADVFLRLPILKHFKRGRYNLSKLGAEKHLLAAVLEAWKEFGGTRRPNIAIVEFKEPLRSDPGEGALLAEVFSERAFATRVVSPEELEYKNGKLRAADFEIDVAFRRLHTRELVVRFSLSHPLLLAYRDRAVCVVNSFRSEIGNRRALFDLVTDETVTARLSIVDRKFIREFVPWTRVVAQKKTKYWEQEIDLPEFIRSRRQGLVLRPNEDTDGHRVFVGAELDQAAWERALRIALTNPYVVQERMACAPQKFPLFQYGEFQMKQAEISVHPYIFNGRMRGASGVVRTCGTGAATSPLIAPVLLLEKN
ncbi:MAG: hypothetical protein ACJ74Z_23255 [Bryobacteraceae bacterium]